MTVASTKPLKYLFTALYADGSTYVQTADDKSILDPEKRSQFYDVMQIAEKKQLVAFVLKGDDAEGNHHEYGVDLRDGHFEVDGMPFSMHEDTIYGFELIFFRQHTHDFEQSRTKDTETKHDVVYRLGWKLKDNQQYQRVMQID